ncbi:CBS domain-containing protein [Gracilibacillus sp. YIM 98692]|uniref:CBS domain-containing protein n=1 Tax=Gracilibacillus sp. YIM 98692 TaxID=2663532 RepID=UPI0013D4AC2C|nr:CBS domain-containing protein [Gracilibacillus sp. YIM 98692]
MKSVRDIMTDDVRVCTPDDSLQDAARLMKERNVGAIPVCGNNKELLGMVTDRDLAVRGYADNKQASTAIKEVMSDHLYHVEPNADLQQASNIMAEHQVRRLPVVEQGKLVGILALGDLSLEDMSDQAAGQALEEISERPELH